ncbi:hypothetical protein SUGI_0194480 [Cryptomeria japonica]|uniref:LRR receptor-like serine/threonine-protein kinase FEI 1 n=1 Tax=Cryptomeria japonica TaxID=3369 RepID=UPI002408E6B7|nr:LRR receptor-like serine/threonine-protein kinase FEI 1 [Cryptomeria japonica]XP_057821403.1 LRR receptor-like serine/threonine-protein kinase FEI 1 [Cryptomeria japonica]GLJ12606.1 hypothetical protein SUGI_0194480 [Cryptomeria japonica]
MFELRTASLGSSDGIYIIANTIFQWTSVLMTASQLIIIFVLMCLAFTSCSNAINLDGEVLLAFKSQVIDSDGVLVKWKKEDLDPCGWSGVTCDSRTRRVIHLNLPYLKLKGSISSDIGKLSHLRRLALHDNNFFGDIPSTLGNCTQLRALYLQDNFLSGLIPPEFGKLSELKILDISSNTLHGPIPASLAKLTKLSTFNVSTNFLAGPIPSGGPFNTFSSNSFVGNLGLCGKQVNAICKSDLDGLVPSSEPPVPGASGAPKQGHFPSSKKNGRYSTKVLISAVATVGVSLLVALMCFWGCYLYHKFCKVRKRPALNVDEGTSVVMFHGDLPYSSKDILRKIETLDDENIIGSGGFGTVYKLVMDDGNAFALKRIEKTTLGSDRIFERELEILGSVKHRHLVNLRGYCNAPSAKLLIYDFLPGGNLDEVLHDSSQDRPLDWDARVKIAIGAAKGLAYLHHDCSPRIIHRDIKSSNILLDRNLESHVSDFGLAKLLEDQESHITTIVAGTFGYLAPEYMHSGRATEKADVYSFGVLLLELLSGKRPTDSAFIEKGLNVVGWLNILVKENRQRDLIDPRCGGVQSESFEAMLQVAIQCVSASPENRPTMHRALQILESEVMSPCPSDFYDSNSE